jgi:ClpP class serine protease
LLLKGRVWSGKRALEVGLVDALGGLSRAVAIAKREVGIPDDEAVALVELSREQASPLALLTGGGASTSSLMQALLQARLSPPPAPPPAPRGCPQCHLAYMASLQST